MSELDKFIESLSLKQYSQIKHLFWGFQIDSVEELQDIISDAGIKL